MTDEAEGAPPAPAKPARRRMTLEQQAAFLQGLRLRCKMMDGEVAARTTLVLSAEDVEALGLIVQTYDLFQVYDVAGYVTKRVRGRR